MEDKRCHPGYQQSMREKGGYARSRRRFVSVQRMRWGCSPTRPPRRRTTDEASSTRVPGRHAHSSFSVFLFSLALPFCRWSVSSPIRIIGTASTLRRAAPTRIASHRIAWLPTVSRRTTTSSPLATLCSTLAVQQPPPIFPSRHVRLFVSSHKSGSPSIQVSS